MSQPKLKARMVSSISLALVSFGAIAAEAKEPQWYEIATGIIAIPAALIGLAYSYLLIKKTRLEARKTELEIAEKEHALEKLAPELRGSYSVGIRPEEGRLLVLLLVRFVVLYLILHVWGLFEDVFGIVFAGIVVGAQKVLSLSLEGWAVLPLVALQKLPKVAYWLIFFGLGWPLFKDANAALGIDIKEFLRVSSLKDLKKLSRSKDT